jgi:hypothetical protein
MAVETDASSTTGGARLALPIVPLGFPCVLYVDLHVNLHVDFRIAQWAFFSAEYAGSTAYNDPFPLRRNGPLELCAFLHSLFLISSCSLTIR